MFISAGSGPAFESFPESLTVDEGSEARFSCTISGDDLSGIDFCSFNQP